MNIILCIIDTLRYDFIRAHGANDWIKTPNLDRLAARSLIFDHAYTASYPTIPHRTDVMTGEYADAGNGPFHPWKPLRFDVPTLPRLLANAGYATQLIHDTPHLVNGGHAFDWPFAAWTFVRGAEVDRPWIDDQGLAPLENWKRDPLFDFVSEAELQGMARKLLLSYSRANRNRRYPEDWNVARLFRSAEAFLYDNAGRGQGGKGDFFLWLDCFDPHEPWDIPPGFVKLYDPTPGYDGTIDPRAFLGAARRAPDGGFPPGVSQRQLALYAGKVSWVDAWAGRVLDALEHTGLLDTTAIILTADHGTNLGERGGFGKTGVVNEQEAHVPLLISGPGIAPGRCDAIVQPQDIFTTILAVAGQAPPLSSAGRNLLDPDARGGRALAIGGLAVNTWRGKPEDIVFTVFERDAYMNVAADPAACRLFSYGSVENIAEAQPDRVWRMREAGLEEAAWRGLDPRLLSWLCSKGHTAFPEACAAWPGPPEWRVYWERAFEE